MIANKTQEIENSLSHIKRGKSCLRARWLIPKNHSSTKRKDCCWNYQKEILYEPILSFRISFLSNVRYYFPAFRCFCASCVEWRFHVEISIANSSIYNQRNSLSTDLQTSILVLWAAYFLIYFIPRFPYSSAIVSCEDMAMVPWKLASRPQKLCLCEKNTENRTLQLIWAAVARMDMRIWKYLLKARVVFANVKFFLDSF